MALRYLLVTSPPYCRPVQYYLNPSRTLHKYRRVTSTSKVWSSTNTVWSSTSTVCSSTSCTVSPSTSCTVSSLYVSNEIARHTAPVQLDLDLSDVVTNFEEVQRNLNLRGSHFDLVRFSDSYRRMVELMTQLKEIERERNENTEKMKEIINDESVDDKTKAELRNEGRKLKKALKPITRELRTVEEEVMLNALRLPNRISPNTEPDDVIYRQNGEPGDGAPHCDVIPGGNLLFKPTSPGCAYLTGDLALLEHAILSYFTDRLEDAGYVPVVAPDIYKTIVIEGCALNPGNFHQISSRISPQSKFINDKASAYSQLEHGQFVTGISAMSMTSFFTRCITDSGALPGRYQYSGRSYKTDDSTRLPSLLNLGQSCGTHIFLTGADRSDCLQLFKESRDLLWEIYTDFDLPITLSKVGVRDLSSWETGRYDLHCHLPGTGTQTRLSSLTSLEDFTSRRLMMRVGSREQQPPFNYHHIVHGEILNVHKLMAAILENHDGQDGVNVPEPLLKHWIGPAPQNGVIFRRT